jgi:predicted phosphodiesterase
VRIGIISDIHSNLEALETALDWLEEHGANQIICLGDVVGYGADPNPCCDLVRERAAVTLLGNHDAAVIGVMDISYYYDAARDAIYWTRDQLSPANFRWLYGLPYTYQQADAAFFHSAPIRPSGFYYVVQTKDALAHTAMYAKLKSWNFVGHSHLVNQYMINERKAKDVTGRPLAADADRKYLINVGSVGQPRDKDPRLCFGLYDAAEATFEHIRLTYNIESASKKILGAGLDPKFAKRLYLGQ